MGIAAIPIPLTIGYVFYKLTKTIIIFFLPEEFIGTEETAYLIFGFISFLLLFWLFVIFPMILSSRRFHDTLQLSTVLFFDVVIVIVFGMIYFIINIDGKEYLTKDECDSPFTETFKCRGAIVSFQKDHFFELSFGVPDESFCQQLVNKPVVESEGATCHFDQLTGWQRIDCGDYRLSPGLKCFICSQATKAEMKRELFLAFGKECENAFAVFSANEPMKKIYNNYQSTFSYVSQRMRPW